MYRFLLLGFFTFLFGFSLATAGELYLKPNEGKLYRLGAVVRDVLITNPEIADVQMTQSNGLFVYGKRSGRTHIVALADNDVVVFERFVTVNRDLKKLETLFKSEFPESNVSVQLSPGRLILSGNVDSALTAKSILSLASGYLVGDEKLVDTLKIASPVQVNLRVRVMEMNRVATKNIGINWNLLLNPGSMAINLISGRSPLTLTGSAVPGSTVAAGGSSTQFGSTGTDASFSAIVDALVEDKLITVLAEPNLTSRSGETASFFAGGEFPIPIASDDNGVTIEFKKYGVLLDMTPTVISPNRIRLHIRPEVSELSSAGAVILNGITIPGIAIRRTEATIELASGQSFSVAGLLQSQKRDLVREVPWLGQLEVLGPLFRSKEYQSSETELVIIATVNIVKPLSNADYLSPLAVDYRNEQNMRGPEALPQNRDTAPETREIRTKDGIKLYGPRGYIF